MTATKYLIVNADDLGLSQGVNQGVIAAYERGIVTSASLMVRFAAAAEAVQWVKQGAGLSLGLHVDARHRRTGLRGHYPRAHHHVVRRRLDR